MTTKILTNLQIFCRQGRVMLVTSPELSNLLESNDDYVMVVPMLFNKEHVQIQKADNPFLENQLPNVIITSPYKILSSDPFDEFGNSVYLNSKPIDNQKLIEDNNKLRKEILMYSLI